MYKYAKPTSTSLEPPKSLEPIRTPGYELHPCFIKLIRDKSFSGEGDENSYSHLQEFEQTYACLCIAGMSDNTIRWKLFPFSLIKLWCCQIKENGNIGIVKSQEVCKEIGKCYALNFVYVSFPSLKWLASKRGSKFQTTRRRISWYIVGSF